MRLVPVVSKVGGDASHGRRRALAPTNVVILPRALRDAIGRRGQRERNEDGLNLVPACACRPEYFLSVCLCRDLIQNICPPHICLSHA